MIASCVQPGSAETFASPSQVARRLYQCQWGISHAPTCTLIVAPSAASSMYPCAHVPPSAASSTQPCAHWHRFHPRLPHRFAGVATGADDALGLFGSKRTRNGKGVTLPRLDSGVPFPVSLLSPRPNAPSIPSDRNTPNSILWCATPMRPLYVPPPPGVHAPSTLQSAAVRPLL